MFGKNEMDSGMEKKNNPEYIHISKIHDLLNDLPLEVAFYDPSGRYRFMNDRYIGDPVIRKNLIGRKEQTYSELLGIAGESMAKRAEMFKRVVTEKTVIHFTEKLYIPTKKKTLFYKRTFKPLFLDKDQGLLAGIFLFGTDISTTILGQKEVKYMAYHDILTGLKNRYAFNEYLEGYIKDNPPSANVPVMYILYCDLNNFRVVNESLGHEIGDRVVKEVSSRIKLCTKESDLVFRTGGNEFAVIMKDIKNNFDMKRAAEKIISYLSTSYSVDGFNITYLSCSIGIVSYPNDGDNKQLLMKNANIALYNAKRIGENTYQVFSQKMTDTAHRRVLVKKNLQSIVEHKEFENQFDVHYHPIVEKNIDGSYHVAGAEALIRWFHPQIGAIEPSFFIPIAEENNLIPVIGEWVIRRVLKDFISLADVFENPPYISINISSKQFASTNLHKRIIKDVESAGIDPKYLQMEITETSLLHEDPKVKENIDALIEKGFRLAIDDFGVGYASLAYLHKIPAAAVKIDQSFIKMLGTSDKHQKLVKSIIMLGTNLGKEIIAEGVERTEDLYLLDSYGCFKYQGYLFSQPLSLDDFKAYLQEENLLTTLIHTV